MTYQINQKINPYPQSSTGLNNDTLKNIDSEKLKQDVNQGIDNNPAVQIVKNDTFVKTGLTLGFWLGISQLMNKFNKACATSTDGKANLLDKVRDFGDKIGEHKIFQSKGFNSVLGFKEKVKVFLRKNIVDKSAILRAFVDTPTKPTNSMAIMMSHGTIAETAQDAMQAFEKYAEISKNGTANVSKLKELGLTVEEIEKMSKEPHLHVDKIVDICRRKGSQEFVDLAKTSAIMPLFQPVKNASIKILGENLYGKLFGRKIYFSEVANKLEALKGAEGNYGKTFMGKVLPKTFLRVTEGLTNGTAGGKLMILMQAGFLADAIINTIKAPKGEKFKTFTENMTQNLAMYLTIPISIKLMHHLGGLKYIGMSKEQVGKYRQALEEFNKKAKAGVFWGNKAALKQERKALKNMLKGDTKLSLKNDGALKTAWKSIKNIIEKPLKCAGSTITVGLETTLGMLKPGAGMMENFFRDFGSRFKRGAGFPMRFILGMMVFIPFFSDLAVRASHLIFGRPKKSVLDKEEEPKKEQKPPHPIMPQQAQNQIQPTTVMQPAQQNKNLAQNMAQIQRENLIDMYKTNSVNNSMNNQPVQIQRENLIDAYKTNPTVERSVITPQEPARTYIPSSDGVYVDPNISKKEDDKLTAAFNKADVAEKLANQYIHR